MRFPAKHPMIFILGEQSQSDKSADRENDIIFFNVYDVRRYCKLRDMILVEHKGKYRIWMKEILRQSSDASVVEKFTFAGAYSDSAVWHSFAEGRPYGG